MEPMVGFEPTTYSLRKSCSATELHRHHERETGIEPAYLAWEASVLPLYYSRTTIIESRFSDPTRNAEISWDPPVVFLAAPP